MAPETRSSTRQTRSSARLQATDNKVTVTRGTSRSSMSAVPRSRKAAPKPTQTKITCKRTRAKSPEPDDDSTVKAPNKHAKGNERQVFMNMPVEVFIEIAKYLHPFDLVLLSRVNKFFRELFMSRQAACIWRSAQQNVPNLPPCPDGICEPQYAALLFTEMCSMCGGHAPRRMDPMLLVRLCVKCRDKEAVEIRRVTDGTLVFSSAELMPDNDCWGVRYCLYSEARAIRLKLDELDAAGDEVAKLEWVKERREMVSKRRQDARCLRKWLENREKEREGELEELKRARKSEIVSRLVRLGWEKCDFETTDSLRNKKWNSLVCNAKPLTGRSWRNLLPSLVEIIEINRAERLKRLGWEQRKRRNDREPRLKEWIHAIYRSSTPLARADLEVNTNGEESGSVISEPTRQSKSVVVCQSFPGSNKVTELPEFVELLENDMSKDEFELELVKKQPMLERSIANWRSELEKILVRKLPKDTRKPDFNVPGLIFTTGHDEPISCLPPDTQKLLRADVFFDGYDSTLIRYPADFTYVCQDMSQIKYNHNVAKISKVLLNMLGRPDASYLELEAMGPTFRCGRCHMQHYNHTWKGILNHYGDEIKRWSQQEPSTHAAKNITYIFTHDTSLTNYHKPFVRVGVQETKICFDYEHTYQCKLCQSLDIYCTRLPENLVVEHLADVHLINEPEKGVHYN